MAGVRKVGECCVLWVGWLVAVEVVDKGWRRTCGSR